jgi:hypothetical protein
MFIDQFIYIKRFYNHIHLRRNPVQCNLIGRACAREIPINFRFMSGRYIWTSIVYTASNVWHIKHFGNTCLWYIPGLATHD